MRVCKVSFAIAAAMAWAVPAYAETALPIPAGYELIEGTYGVFFLKADSIRSNTTGSGRVTTAVILSLTTLQDGTDIYALGEFRASCDSNDLMRHRVSYVSADQKLLGRDDKPVAVNVTDGTSDAALYTRLCSDWDQYDR